MKQVCVILLLMISFFKGFAFENDFFKCDIPKTWERKFERGGDPSPYELNVFLNNSNGNTIQFFYSFISKQIPNPKDVICVHIESKLDNSGLEKLCHYTEEKFHGYKATKYSFAGNLFGAYGRGQAYAFLSNGYVLLFVNFYVPSLGGKMEFDIWKNFQLMPPNKWMLTPNF